VTNFSDAFVNVVNSVDWCGGVGTFGGCAYIGAHLPMVISRERATSAARGVVSLCSAGSSSLVAGDVDTDTALAPIDEIDYTGVSIDSLADRGFLDVIPTELDQYYARADVNILKRRLLDNREFDRRTVPALIGLISDGDISDVQALIDYAECPGADVSAALMSVGYIVARTGDDSGVDPLIKRLNSADERTYKAAALGLALSGNIRALEALEAKAPKEYDPYNILSTAPFENRAVASLGLAGYYARPRKPGAFKQSADATAGIE